MRWFAWVAVWLVACTTGDPKIPSDTDDSDAPTVLDADHDGVNDDRDCVDDNPFVFPGASEICDGQDNDCDGDVDDDDDSIDPRTATEYYDDFDEDGYGAASKGFFCGAPRRGALVTGDCDDADPKNFPGNPELCDGQDNDCDEILDDADPDIDPASARTWFSDLDRDGFGDPASQDRKCEQPADTVSNGGDCDDTDPLVWTSKPEACNGFDDNCDGLLDEADPTIDPATLLDLFADADGDFHGDAGTPVRVCTPLPGYVESSDDCDDQDPSRFPGAPELCDTIDNDCDGDIDDADSSLDPLLTPTWYRDADHDGHGDPATGVQACTQPSGRVATPDDCDDGEALAWTGKPEVCDRVDNDCSGATDEDDPGLDPALLSTFYADRDGDGRGDPDSPLRACFLPSGASATADDCNDAERRAWTGRAETCDGVDNDCSGTIDEDPVDGDTYYVDADSDGRGDPATAFEACAPPPDTSTNPNDCDDTNPAAWTGRPETCDGVDNDCDLLVDTDDPSVDPASGETWYIDADGDGRGDPLTGLFACSPPPGRIVTGGDCDDAEPLAWTGKDEVCDGVDNDCDGAADDADPGLVLSSATRYFADSDGDGHGDPATSVRRCVQPPDTTTTSDDCDDSEPLAWIGHPEVCDGVDNDCQRGADDADPGLDTSTATTWYEDLDGDGYGNPTRGVLRCARPPTSSLVAGDCNDRQPLAWTGAPEVCDGVDNDCDGAADDADPDLVPGSAPSWYADEDGDGYGDPTTIVRACLQPADAVTTAGDCDDDEPLAWAGAAEVCDGGVDNNCNGKADDLDPTLDVSTRTTWYADHDGDGYGAGAGTSRCAGPPGAVDNNGDCNDAEPLAWTGATEVCDGGIDNDCNGRADDADPGLDRDTATTFYPDADRDGHGAKTGQFRRCVATPGTAVARDDCNDAEPLAWDGHPEVCDGVDNDCDGGTDDADPGLDISTATRTYDDDDGDGFGDPLTAGYYCVVPPGESTLGTDCHDGDAGVYPGAPEVCNGKDDDCDTKVDMADPSITGVPSWYVDSDRDGWGVGTGIVACFVPGRASRSGDCDDTRATRSPGAVEVCDGIDNDCDPIVDVDAWWDLDWPYRVMVTVDAASEDVYGPPIAVDVDLGAVLSSLGDAAPLAAHSVRVVHQRCSLGLPEIPSEFMDGVSGIFDPVPVDDPIGDESGSVVFLYDQDGDTSTLELFPGGSQATFAIYFASTTTASGLGPAVYPSGLQAFSTGTQSELSNDRVTSTYLRSSGGLTATLGTQGGDPRVGSQASTFLGNGLYLNVPGGGPTGAWLPARDPAARLSVVHDGPVFGAVRTEGSVSSTYGGFDYVYTYMLFDGRPEVYAKVEYVINRPTHLGPQGTSWSAAVRPLLIDNNAIVTSGVSGVDGARDATGYSWVRGGYGISGVDPFGVASGYRVPPAHKVSPVWATNGRWVGLSGQDFNPSPVGTEVDLRAGDRVVDNTMIVIYPFEGLFAAGSQDFLGTLDGTSATVSSPEGR